MVTGIAFNLFLRQLLLSQFIEECSEREEVDELETSYERESKKKSQQSTKSSKNAKPVLVHIFAVVRCYQVVEENVDKWLVGEVSVFKETHRVVRETTV